MSHTPGPWTVLYGGHGTDGYFVIASRGGDTLICDSSPRQLLPEAELNANARLIAAAPALLDALEDMVSLYEPADEMTYPPAGVPRKVSAVALARRVIAEVRGIEHD